MRICLLSRSLYPLIGGSETYVYAVGESLVRLGHDVVVVTSVLPAQYSGGHRYPFKVVRIPGLSEFNSAQAPLSVLAPLYETLTRLRPDLIHVQNILLGVALTLIRRSLPDALGIVFTDHNTPIPDERRWISGINCYDVELSLGRFFFEQGAYDIAVTPSNRFFSWALQCGAPRNKVLLIRHGVDLQRFSPGSAPAAIRRRLCNNPEAFLLLVAGRLVKRKGILPVLNALSNPLLANRRVHLAVTTSENTSEPEFLSHIRTLVGTPQLRERVTFLIDAFAPREMPDVYRACDCVLLPSSAEGFGLVGIEALACGIPLVASLSPGIDEYLEPGFTGLAVNCDSSAEIATAVSRLIENPSLRLFLSRNGRSLVMKDFDQAAMIRSLERSYLSVIEGDTKPLELNRSGAGAVARWS